MATKATEAALYGIKNSNRNFREQIYWGKNQFNSSFPVALCCYMRDKGLSALNIELESGLGTKIREIPISEMFGTELKNEEIFFRFESDYSRFRDYVADSLEKIDVVISAAKDKSEIRPLEIKLTTLPDDGTSDFPEDKYGTELVIRSPTMRYVALSMADSNKAKFSEIRKIFEPVCKRIDNWENIAEMKSHQEGIFSALKEFLSGYCHTQKPLLVQPVWKTVGKSPTLAENCLDVFCWTDFSIMRLICDSLDEDEPKKITRPQRAALRLARFLYEVSRDSPVYQKPIYDGMTYDTLNDKEFAVSGRRTNKHMFCERLVKPAVKKNEIKNIVLGGGHKYLSPERRFDSILYFSEGLFDE